MTDEYSYSTRRAGTTTIFSDKGVLKTTYAPTNLSDILHRKEEIHTLMDYTNDVFDHISPGNIFIYGRSGLGKSLICNLTVDMLEKEAEAAGIEICVIKISCDVIRTEFAIINELIRQLPAPEGQTKRKAANDESAKRAYYIELVDAYPGIIIVVLDELDKAKNPSMINTLIRSKSATSKQSPTVIAITNDVTLKDSFPPELLSVIADKHIFVDPYDEDQIRDILTARAKLAFKEGTVTPEAIALCARFSAQEHGDIRKAIDLMRFAGEIVVDDKCDTLTEGYITLAENRIKSDKVVKSIGRQPTQYKVALLASAYVFKSPRVNTTANIHSVYTEIAKAVKLDTIVEQRRLRDILKELSQLGAISLDNVNGGRSGRKKLVVSIESIDEVIDKILDDDKLTRIADVPPSAFVRVV